MASGCKRPLTRGSYHETLPGVIGQSNSLIRDSVPLRYLREKKVSPVLLIVIRHISLSGKRSREGDIQLLDRQADQQGLSHSP